MTADLRGGRLALATIGLVLALFLAALDQTIVGTALPRIVAELKGLDYYSWVLTAYLVASTTMTPISGKLGDLFGRKPVLIVGMVGFVLASMLCGQSQNMLELVLFRGLQGLFGGTLFSTVFASVADLYSLERRGRIQGVFGGVFGLASVIGPTVGGFLTDNLGWRWVFYVNLPVGIAAVAFVLLTLPRTVHTASWRDVDFVGAGALAAGLVPILVAFSITSDHAWTSAAVLGLLGAGSAMLLAFYVLEQRTAHPIVPFALFANRTFTVSVIVGFLTSVGMFGTIVFVPLVYQGVLGIAATNSGLLITPMSMGLVFASIVTGQLILRVKRYRYIGTVGVALLAVGIWRMAQVAPTTQPSDIVISLVLVGLGVGSTFPLYLNSVQAAVEPRFIGVVTSQIQFFRNIGATVGTAILGSILSQRLPLNLTARIDALGLPSQLRSLIPEGSGAEQTLFDPAALAAQRAQVPAAFVPAFDSVIGAVRAALATTLDELYLVAFAVILVGLAATVFLDDVPIRTRGRAEHRPAGAAAAFGE